MCSCYYRSRLRIESYASLFPIVLLSVVRETLSHIVESAGGVVVVTSACHAADAGGTGSIPGIGNCDINIWLSTLGTVYLRESENHVNVGPVSIWEVKDPLRTTSTLAVTILSDSCVSPRLGCLE